MTKYFLIIAIILLALYLYWKSQQKKNIAPKPEDIIERKGKQKEVFWDANDWEINSDNDNYHG